MILKNQPWIRISVVILLFWLVTAIKNQTAIYYFKYTLNNEGLVPLANSFTLASLLGVILIMHLSNLHGNKRTMLVGIVTAFIGQLVLMLGVYSSGLPVLFTGIVINAIGHGMIVGLVSIMIADTIRYGMTMGIQAEGILAASDNFGVNVGLGVGGLITAGLFQLSGYVPDHAQNAATLSMINWNYVWIPLVIYLVMFAVLWFYDEQTMNDALNLQNQS